jgi:hypothetical protein
VATFAQRQQCAEQTERVGPARDGDH